MEGTNSGRFRARVALIPLAELRLYGIFKQRGVAGDNRQARGRDEVASLIFDGIVANDCPFRDVDIAVDDGAAYAAVATDIAHGRR